MGALKATMKGWPVAVSRGMGLERPPDTKDFSKSCHATEVSLLHPGDAVTSVLLIRIMRRISELAIAQQRDLC